jgi:phage shock protein PspC (stress-responsive transcriptional regulator)
MEKKLMRSRKDKKFLGVCGGLAEYLGCDSTIIRLILALSVLFLGFGGLAYLVAALIMPEAPEN